MPSFLPWASWSSTPTQSPSAKSVVPRNCTVPGLRRCYGEDFEYSQYTSMTCNYVCINPWKQLVASRDKSLKHNRLEMGSHHVLSGRSSQIWYFHLKQIQAAQHVLVCHSRLQGMARRKTKPQRSTERAPSVHQGSSSPIGCVDSNRDTQIMAERQRTS